MLFLISGLPAWAADDGPILVDLEPPRITIIQPVDSATITEERPWIEVEISDEGSGINSDAIFISVNGVDVTAGAIIERIDREEIGAPLNSGTSVTGRRFLYLRDRITSS